MNSKSELNSLISCSKHAYTFYQTFTLRLSAGPEPLSFINVVMILPPEEKVGVVV